MSPDGQDTHQGAKSAMANIPNSPDPHEPGEPCAPRDYLNKAVKIVGAFATRCGAHELMSQVLAWLFS